MKYIYNLIIVLTSIIITNCSVVSFTNQSNKIVVYNCDQMKVIYSPSDSSKIIIYPSWYKSPLNEDKNIFSIPFYKDSTIISYFETGVITIKLLKMNSDNSEWYEYTCSNIKPKNIDREDCSNVISDSDKKVIELIKTSLNKDEKGDVIYSFEIVFSYGTIHYCYELKIIEKERYKIRLTGLIL